MSNQGHLVPIAPEPTAVDTQAAMMERFATNPDVSVEKLERLMALWQQAEDRRAATAFNVAMSTAQKAMRPVAADADNPQTRSRYASYAALDRALRPIYTEHGFGLSFNTGDAPGDSMIRVLCDVTHVGGGARTYHIDMPADGKGARGGDVMTRTHATGSAVSYGMRYLLKMIWNVAIGSERDDDGNRAGARPSADTPERQATSGPVAPDGAQQLLATLTTEAAKGMPSLMAAWNKAPLELRNYIIRARLDDWDDLKASAADVTKAAGR